MAMILICITELVSVNGVDLNGNYHESSMLE